MLRITKRDILAAFVFLIFLSFCLLATNAQPQTKFDCKFHVTWDYPGTNADTKFLLYWSLSESDTLHFAETKPILCVQAILESADFTISTNPYVPNYFGARDCLFYTQDTIFSEWVPVLYIHRLGAPENIEIVW